MEDAQYAKLTKQAVRLVSLASMIGLDDDTDDFLPIVGDMTADVLPDLLVAVAMVGVAIARAAEDNGCAKSARELIQEVALQASATPQHE